MIKTVAPIIKLYEAAVTPHHKQFRNELANPKLLKDKRVHLGFSLHLLIMSDSL